MEKAYNKLNFIQLSKINSEIEKDTSAKLNSGEATTIKDFFMQEGKDLGDRLAATNILGVPALAIFSSTDICASLCDPISRLFVLASIQPNAQVVTGISNKIAYNNYDNYCKDKMYSHHTWAEVNLDGTVWALDFTDQLAMPAQTYYSVYQYNTDCFARLSPAEIATEGLINQAFLALAQKLQSLTKNSINLQNEYNLLFKNSVYHQDITDVQQFMNYTQDKLAAFGLSARYPSLSNLLLRSKGNVRAAKLLQTDACVQNVLDIMLNMFDTGRLSNEVKQGSVVLSQVFDKTDEMYNYINSLVANARSAYKRRSNNGTSKRSVNEQASTRKQISIEDVLGAQL